MPPKTYSIPEFWQHSCLTLLCTVTCSPRFRRLLDLYLLLSPITNIANGQSSSPVNKFFFLHSSWLSYHCICCRRHRKFKVYDYSILSQYYSWPGFVFRAGHRPLPNFNLFAVTIHVNTPSPHPMHPVFLIDEILRRIFYFCSEYDQHSLVCSARTCKAWKDPALDLVWNRLFSLSPLLLLLPGISVSNNEYVSTCVFSSET